MTSCEVIVSLHIKLLQPAHVPKYEFRTRTGHILEDNLLMSEVLLFSPHFQEGRSKSILRDVFIAHVPVRELLFSLTFACNILLSYSCKSVL